MSLHQEVCPGGQSVGTDPRSKRNSGLFAFLRWFKPSNSRESVNSDVQHSSGSCESLTSTHSAGTVASFSFVAPTDYKAVSEKSIAVGPETDTYKARLKQRDRRREKDKNITLRKKYNLFFNRDTLHKPQEVDDNSKSLPLMTKKNAENEKVHRRTNSDSSKMRRAGAYCHVKGKRRAPQPPNPRHSLDNTSTTSLRRKKRLAPPPPPSVSVDKILNTLENADGKDEDEEEDEDNGEIEYADADIIYNDSLKLDHGILKPLKLNPLSPSSSENNVPSNKADNSNRSSYVEAPVSPRPWYKRNPNRDSLSPVTRKDTPEKERLPEVQFMRNLEIETAVQGKENAMAIKPEENEEVKLQINKAYQKPNNSNNPAFNNQSFINNYFNNKTKSDDKSSSSKSLNENTDNKLDNKPFKTQKSLEEVKTKSSLFKQSDNKLPQVKEAFFKNKENQKQADKRKSGLVYLTNITELDREASEIIKNDRKSELNIQEMPAFMRPRQEEEQDNQDTLSTPKRKSARDLIAKFNAITNVTKVTVNTAFFGGNGTQKKRDYFGRNKKTGDKNQNEVMAKNLELDKTKQSNEGFLPLAKCESTSAVRTENEIEKKGANKLGKKVWFCPKCSLENEYWRIICHVCSTIKPYFDDLTSSKTSLAENENQKVESTTKLNEVKGDSVVKIERNFERAKTQIGFSALAKYNTNASKETNDENKREEREKLKKMLIEMKNSLPKRKSKVTVNQNGRASIIDESLENGYEEQSVAQNSANANNTKVTENKTEKEEDNANYKVNTVEDKNVDEEKKIEILVAKTESIYENILVRKTENPKPIKVSSSVQTSAVVKKTDSPTGAIKKTENKNLNLMRPKDFENIYNDKNRNTYANVQNDPMSLFVNMPKNFSEIKNNFNQPNNTDTLEINRLLRRLETAIAKGELTEAAIYARELAQLKINCSVIRQKNNTNKPRVNEFVVNLYVEDKISHRGPFPITVTETQTVQELKEQVANELDIPVNTQRWILGKELAVNDAATLKDHNITMGCPIFLYLVAPNDLKADNLVKTEANVVQPKAEAGPSKINSPQVKNNVLPSQSKPEATKPDKTLADAELTKKDTKIESPNVVVKEVQTKTNVVHERKDNVQIRVDNVNKTTTPVVEKMEQTNADFDDKTLKPKKEWVCKMCTLINPSTNNVCGVCATVKQFSDQPGPSAAGTARKKKRAPSVPKEDQHYKLLLNLDNADLVENMEAFECLICMTDANPGEGVTLRECLHQFCKQCLAHTIEFCDEAQVKCPYRDNDYSCDIALQDREIKALVTPEVYEAYLAKSVAQAENKSDKSFHCKTPDCKGWCIFEDNVNEFRCPVCRKINCLTCQAIHTGMNCKQYQESVNSQSETNEDAKQTKQMLDEMVAKGEALICPTCHVVLMKKWGCDWVRCSMCKTEICWVTRGPRWGPGGKGDTTGGCKCGVNGVKCHPQCNYCH